MTARPNHRSLLARRRALAALATSPLAVVPAAAPAQQRVGALAPTPTQTLGPFYPRSPRERPEQIDNDLLVTSDASRLADGTALYLSGRVIDRHARPLGGARVEIWQCDANAVYHHPIGGAEDQRDPHFQGYGQTTTDADGRFQFRTIRPVPYPGRTPHIHVRVQADGRQALATQLYVAGEAGNANDVLYRRLTPAEQAALTLNLQPTTSADPLAQATRLSANIDLVLA